MRRVERENPHELPKFIDQLRRFIEVPKPGEKPLVYLATRQSQFDFPQRDKSKPHLYRADQLTVDEFMNEVYPFNEYGDYRDVQKAEQWVMPGFDCYVVPIELDSSSRNWSFDNEVATALAPIFFNTGPNWDEAIEEALGITNTENEDQALIQGVQKHMATLLPIFQQAGPIDVPHFHVSWCLGLDNYAHEWLGLSDYQISATSELGKTPVEIFNQRYGSHGLRYGRMMTVRYFSYKPGSLGGLQDMLHELAMRDLGAEPDVVQQKAAIVEKKLSELQQDPDFATFWKKHNRTKDKNVIDLVRDYLAQLPDAHSQTEEIQNLLKQITNLFDIAEKVEELAKEYFDNITQAYFGLTADEFMEAYQAKIQWLVKERDAAVIEMAHRLGVSALIERNSFDTGKFKPMSTFDFPDGGVLLKQETHPMFDGKPSQMIMAYPAPSPIEDKPTIARWQFFQAVENVTNGFHLPVVISNDPELDQTRDQYIEKQIKYESQFQSFSAIKIISGEVTAEQINDSTETIFVTEIDEQQFQGDSILHDFIKAAISKVFREGRGTYVGPSVIIFASQNDDLRFLPIGSRKAHFSKTGREISTEVSEL